MNNRELDYLEKDVIKTISRYSVYSVLQVKNVYLRVNSFDKTIAVLKTGVSKAVSLDDAIEFINKQKKT
ncbi:hypothetical protein MHM83_11005 [Tenacibaculum sp. Mcav3-52]|uniref:hypothetical protein n=1 Tax=Tenacibaculum sp. Mcav3-52 TaxID=2917762 RepID=UPI001EF33BB0|nr:hypothetical protein [Tenacibaculum sp. Mcav3-52]MCG7502401.1 hypothetical protein [Tenacibaculum sp. Mcav3-52]